MFGVKSKIKREEKRLAECPGVNKTVDIGGGIRCNVLNGFSARASEPPSSFFGIAIIAHPEACLHLGVAHDLSSWMQCVWNLFHFIWY